MKRRAGETSALAEPTATMGRHRRRQQTLGRAAVWFGGGYAVSTLAFLAVTVVSGRLLGLDDFGYMAVIVAVSAAVVPLATMGANRTGMREAAKYAVPSVETLSLIRSQTAAVCRLSAPAVALCSAPVGWALSQGGPGMRLSTAAATALLTYACALQRLWADILRGLGEQTTSALLSGRVSGPLTGLLQVLLLGGILATGRHVALGVVLWALVVGYVPGIVWGWFRVWSLCRAAPRLPTLRSVASTIRDGREFVVVQIAAETSQNVELWVAAVLLTATATSLLGAAARLAALVAFALTVLQLVFGPVIARLWTAGEARVLEQLLRTGAFVVTVIALIGISPILVAPRLVLTTAFGDSFRGAAPALVLLALGAFSNVASGLCGVLLVMTHHDAVAARIQVAALLGRVVVAVVAASVWGINGLALGSLLVSLVLNTTNWWWARRLLGINTLPTLRPRLRLAGGFADL